MAGIFVLLFILFFLLGGIIVADLGYISYTTRCGDTPLGECLKATPTPTPNPETTVTAVGSFSAKGYGVSITMNVPLSGGAVSGTFTGDCQGTIRGTFDGNNNGVVSGSAHGSCNPFVIPIPVSATFTGKVDQDTKTIPISGEGVAAGVSGSGSLVLTFVGK